MHWTLHPIREFKNFQDAWHNLNLQAFASPLLDPEFIMPLLQIFGTSKEILACCHENNELLAMAILVQKNRWVWSTFQPSQAPLGAWVSMPGQNLSKLLSSLIESLPGYPLLLGVTQQDPDLLARPQEDIKLKTLDYIETARISIHESFEDYWDKRGKNLRQNMKKQRNKLEKNSIATRLEITKLPDQIAQAINDYGKIESSGWKSGYGTAIQLSNQQGQFYESMLKNFAQHGNTLIYRYWYNDQIVAMDLCITDNNCIIILKTTYSEALSNSTSPAFLMHEALFNQLFDEQKINKIEFYGKIMDWHTKWSEETRTIYHINYYRFSFLVFLQRLIKKIVG